MQGGNVLRSLRRELACAGLPRIRFHDLRHATGSHLVASGADVAAVAAILGHSQITTTLNTYSHALPEATRAAISKADSLVGRTG
ncbi:MAG: hypothetical protein CL878_09570 [Dehalococcoidia bacterium]|nr:hypothetical protein [Dehalococcoidia bacterium]